MEKHIIGISLGTRTMGVAVMKNGILKDYRIKTFKGKWSEEKLATILLSIENLMKENPVSKVAVKTPDSSRTSLGIIQIIYGVKLLCKKKKIAVEEFTIEEIKRMFKVENKNELIEVVLKAYPELCVEYERQMKNRNPYYEKVFEAISLGKIME